MGVCGIKQASSKQDNSVVDDIATVTTSTQKSTARISLVSQIPLTFSYRVLKQECGQIKLAEHKATQLKRSVTYYQKPLSTKEDHALTDRFTQLISLAHPNIQKFYDVYAQEQQYLVLQDCIDGVPMEEYMTQFKQNDARLRNILRHILHTLLGLHSKGIYHGAFCPDNIVFNSMKRHAQVKLVFNQKLPANAVHFKSPEVIKGHPITLKSDVWSFGVLVFNLLSGLMPFQHRDILRVPNCILKGVYEMSGHEWENVPQDVKLLIDSMLQYKEKDRPSVQQILNHQWFKKKVNDKLNRKQTRMFQRNAKEMDKLSCKNKIQQAAMMHIIENDTKQRNILRLMHIFKKLDADNSGTLSKDELLHGYTQLMPKEEAEQQVEKIFQQFDCDGSGEVDYNEFLLANCLKEKMISKEKLTKVFKCFDEDGQGQLTFKEVSKLLVRMKMSKGQIRQAMNEFDIDNDGQINLEEFIQGMMNIKQTSKN